jgi:hypothetical protein
VTNPISWVRSRVPALIDDWQTDMHRLWTVRASLFMFILTGAVLGLAAFVDVFNPWFFLGLSCAGYGLIGYPRLVKQVPAADVGGGA